MTIAQQDRVIEAIARGGRAVTWSMPLTDIEMTEEDVEAVLDCLRSGWLTMGPRVQAFERKFAEYVGRRARGGGFERNGRPSPGRARCRDRTGRRGDRAQSSRLSPPRRPHATAGRRRYCATAWARET